MNNLITLGTVAAYGYSLIVTLPPGLLPDDVREVYHEAVGVSSPRRGRTDHRLPM